MSRLAVYQNKARIDEIRQQKMIKKQHEEEQRDQEKEFAYYHKEKGQKYGDDMTNEAEIIRQELVSLLKGASSLPIDVDYEQYVLNEKYLVPAPEKPIYEYVPPEIDESTKKPQYNFLDVFSEKRRADKKARALEKYNEAVLQHQELVKSIQEKNDFMKKAYQAELDAWKWDRDEFYKEQEEHNKQLGKFKNDYPSRDKDAIAFYFELVVSLMDIPDSLFGEWVTEYHPENRILIIDMVLPNIEIIPNLKTKKYVESRKEFSETYIKEKQINEIYDTMILQLCLRVVHDLFISDVDNLLDMVVFNGIHKGINKSTGKDESIYLLSLNAKKEDILGLKIQNVEARSCFNSLKGISAAKLADLIPVAPSITMDRDDKRFVEGVDVAHTIEGQNLASMDWLSFEHLIRELFEKEFAAGGAEIRITQSSRDGGVDAVMFDPDPIRGGKYIIQAKRYTNVVGVSAVRDLYGTLSHEGAVKGILVTTSNFGADSYEFAKDKPLTLINGSNLLFLLQKHGYKARIDIEEAKKLQQI